VLCGVGNSTRKRDGSNIERRSCQGVGDCGDKSFAQTGTSCEKFCQDKGITILIVNDL